MVTPARVVSSYSNTLSRSYYNNKASDSSPVQQIRPVSPVNPRPDRMELSAEGRAYLEAMKAAKNSSSGLNAVNGESGNNTTNAVATTQHATVEPIAINLGDIMGRMNEKGSARLRSGSLTESKLDLGALLQQTASSNQSSYSRNAAGGRQGQSNSQIGGSYVGSQVLNARQLQGLSRYQQLLGI